MEAGELHKLSAVNGYRLKSVSSRCLPGYCSRYGCCYKLCRLCLDVSVVEVISVEGAAEFLEVGVK